MRRRALCVAAAAAVPVLRSGAARAAPAALDVSTLPLLNRSDMPAAKASDMPAALGAELSLVYFGNHFHRLVPEPGQPLAPAGATQWVDGSVGALRLWDASTRWGDIAPSPGVWDFARLDTYVAQARSRGARVLYTLGSTPRWASARPDEPGPYGPGCNAEPVRMAHWEEYVRRVAERYRGRIQAYELWNEPTFSDYARDRQYPGFFTGSVAQMVEMARIARRVLDRVDPKAMLTTPGFVGGPHRLELFLRSGGAKLVQAVSYHFYALDGLGFKQLVLDVRATMQQTGVAHLPLWNTECGVEVYAPAEALPDGVTERLTQSGAAARLAQYLLLGAAQRIEVFFYYAWDSHRSGMIDKLGQRLPRYEALRRVQSWLLGARVAGVEQVGQTAVVVQAMRGAERFMFAWDDAARTVRLPVPAGWRIDSVQALLDGAAPVSFFVPPAVGDANTLALSPAPVRLRLVRT